MQEENKDYQCDEQNEGSDENIRGAKSSHMVITQPSTDFNRYLVDKFNIPTTKSKQAPFESIDFSLYKSSARCSAFCTSESRLLVWITVFANRYYQILNQDDTGYKAVWEEQDAYSTPSKCEKIILHLCSTAADSEDKMVAITVFVSTGRIMIQGKMYEEWCVNEFPVLLDIVNTIEPLPIIEDKSIFTSSLPQFFRNFVQFVPDNDTLSYEKSYEKSSNAEISSKISTETSHTELLSPTLTPSRLKQISTLRDTLGQLEAEFTQYKLISVGDIQQLKDKLVQQDNLLKVQNKKIEDLSIDLSSQAESFNDLLQQHSAQMKKLQDENRLLQKKNAKLLETNAASQAKHRQLETDVDFLKDQIAVLWQKSAGAPNPVPDADDKKLSSNSEEPIQDGLPPKLAIADQDLLLVDLPTQNRFSPLQEETREETSVSHKDNSLPPLSSERHVANVPDDKSIPVTPLRDGQNNNVNNTNTSPHTRSRTTEFRENAPDSNPRNLISGNGTCNTSSVQRLKPQGHRVQRSSI